MTLVLVAFVTVHLARLGMVLVNVDGDNYLWGALRVVEGEFPRHQYSPGFAYLLAPLVKLTQTDFELMHAAVGLLNLALACAALVLVHRFLARRLPPWTAVALVTVFALGQSATNALRGAEVEPLVLLLVSATLVLIDLERPWLAMGTTALCAVSRVALFPFFTVLLILRVRHERKAALTGIVTVGVAVLGYVLAPKGVEGGYVSIASGAYTVGEGAGGFMNQAMSIISDAAVRYCRLGLPAMVWPPALLQSAVGPVFGFGTTAIMGFGAWRVLHRTSADQLAAHAILAAAAYLGLLLLWPAHDEKVVRLVLPVAPLVLLAVGVGATAVIDGLGSRWGRPAGVGLLACVIAAALVSTSVLVVQRSRSEPRVREFLDANQQARERLGPGVVLSTFPAYTEVITGRPSRGYTQQSGLEEMLRAAVRSKACAVIISPLGGDGASLRTWVTETGAPVIAAAGATMVVALPEPSCLPSR